MGVLDVLSIKTSYDEVDDYVGFSKILVKDKEKVDREIRFFKNKKINARVVDFFDSKGDISRYKKVIKKNCEYKDEISLYLEAVGYLSENNELDYLGMLINSYFQLSSYYSDFKKYSDSLITGIGCTYECTMKPDINEVKKIIKKYKVDSLNK